MPDVLELKDGKCRTIFSTQDFEDLVREYMGADSVRCLRELFDNSELLDEIKTLNDEMKETEDELWETKDELEELRARLKEIEDD